MDGFIIVDKPCGVTSRKVVDIVASALKQKKVGHAGTLDPLATGVMVVCVGYATKLVDFIHDLPKAYSAAFLLGRSSPSDDLETDVCMEEHPVCPGIEQLSEARAGFCGEILQKPCDYSAVHVNGQRAYRIARKGRDIMIQPKRVRIDELNIVHYEWPRLLCDVVCSSGTFIRAIGRDLAASVGTSAVMESLTRTAIGPFSQESAVQLKDVNEETVRRRLRPAGEALPHMERFTLQDGMLDQAIRGALMNITSETECIAAVDENGVLVGVLSRLQTGAYRLKPNFRGAG